MRYALLDEVRRLKAMKRQPNLPALAGRAVHGMNHTPELDELLALDQALNFLTDADARLGQLVEMRYFSGMTESEIAHAMGVSDRTVQRDWRKARAFLVSRLDATTGTGREGACGL